MSSSSQSRPKSTTRPISISTHSIRAAAADGSEFAFGSRRQSAIACARWRATTTRTTSKWTVYSMATPPLPRPSCRRARWNVACPAALRSRAASFSPSLTILSSSSQDRGDEGREEVERFAWRTCVTVSLRAKQSVSISASLRYALTHCAVRPPLDALAAWRGGRRNHIHFDIRSPAARCGCGAMDHALGGRRVKTRSNIARRRSRHERGRDLHRGNLGAALHSSPPIVNAKETARTFSSYCRYRATSRPKVKGGRSVRVARRQNKTSAGGVASQNRAREIPRDHGKHGRRHRPLGVLGPPQHQSSAKTKKHRIAQS